MIRYILWKISRRARPDAKFLATMQTQFAPKRVIRFAWRLSAAMSALVLSLGLGTSAYAYGSEEILPDHPLYPLREAVETVEERVVRTPALKSAIQRKHLERKLKEVQKVEEKHPEFREREEGKLLKEVETALKSGLDEKKSPKEIRREVVKKLRAADKKKLRPRMREQMNRLQDRWESSSGDEEREKND